MKPKKIHPLDLHELLTDQSDVIKRHDGSLVVGNIVYELTVEVEPITAEGKRLLQELSAH